MSIFDMLAEQRITEAIRRGDFDHLPGAGRPLDLGDDPFVHGEQRMINRILKNAGCTPPEIGLRREIATLRNEIVTLPDGDQRSVLRRRLALLLLELSARQGR